MHNFNPQPYRRQAPAIARAPIASRIHEAHAPGVGISVASRIARLNWNMLHIAPKQEGILVEQAKPKEKAVAQKKAKPSEPEIKLPKAPKAKAPKAPAAPKVKAKPKAPAGKKKAPRKEKKQKGVTLVRGTPQYALWNPSVPLDARDQTNEIIRQVKDYLNHMFSVEIEKPFSASFVCHLRKAQITHRISNSEAKLTKSRKAAKLRRGPAAATYTFILDLDNWKYSIHGISPGYAPMDGLSGAINSLIIGHEKPERQIAAIKE
jgi:hypothetical protein